MPPALPVLYNKELAFEFKDTIDCLDYLYNQNDDCKLDHLLSIDKNKRTVVIPLKSLLFKGADKYVRSRYTEVNKEDVIKLKQASTVSVQKANDLQINIGLFQDKFYLVSKLF